MANKKVGNFRSNLFGGFNRRDVIDYIKSLHERISELEEDNESLRAMLSAEEVTAQEPDTAEPSGIDQVEENSPADAEENVLEDGSSLEHDTLDDGVTDAPAVSAESADGTGGNPAVDAKANAEAASPKDSPAVKMKISVAPRTAPKVQVRRNKKR